MTVLCSYVVLEVRKGISSRDLYGQCRGFFLSGLCSSWIVAPSWNEWQIDGAIAGERGRSIWQQLKEPLLSRAVEDLASQFWTFLFSFVLPRSSGQNAWLDFDKVGVCIKWAWSRRIRIYFPFHPLPRHFETWRIVFMNICEIKLFYYILTRIYLCFCPLDGSRDKLGQSCRSIWQFFFLIYTFVSNGSTHEYHYGVDFLSSR